MDILYIVAAENFLRDSLFAVVEQRNPAINRIFQASIWQPYDIFPGPGRQPANFRVIFTVNQAPPGLHQVDKFPELSDIVPERGEHIHMVPCNAA